MNLPLNLTPLTHPWALWLLLALPALAVMGTFARWRRRRALSRFGRALAMLPLLPPRPRVRWLAPAAYLTGIVLLAAGVAGPRWGPDPDQPAAPGRDLVVVLDLSRSMLAQDALPSRWERSRAALVRLADAMQERGGHRIGLVVFAAKSKVVCPLTRDFDHFRLKLAELDPRVFHGELRDPSAASGTRIGAGVQAAVAACDAGFPGFGDVLMMSDGDDPAGDNEWQVGVAAARQANIPVHCVGVGDPERDSTIPLPDGGVLKADGKPVLTRLREEPLRELARQTNGSYLRAGREPALLAEFFHTAIEPRPGRELHDDLLPTPKARYPWFLGPAVLCLTIAYLLEDRGRKPPAARTGDDRDQAPRRTAGPARLDQRRTAG